MRISSIDPGRLSRDEITHLLFGHCPDDGKQGDCIFVFGGRGDERVAKAVELFKAGRVPTVLFSGGTRWGTRNPPEAIRMQQEAIALGIPESTILVECESNNTHENVLASRQVLDRAMGLQNIRRLLVVSIPWHMRRCLLTLRTHMLESIGYSWCPADYADHQPHNWWATPEVEAYVMRELKLVIDGVREGRFPDEDVGSLQ